MVPIILPWIVDRIEGNVVVVVEWTIAHEKGNFSLIVCHLQVDLNIPSLFQPCAFCIISQDLHVVAELFEACEAPHDVICLAF